MYNPKEYPKTDKSYIVVNMNNYSDQLIVLNSEKHGEVYAWVKDNTGTRFSDFMFEVARFHAHISGGVVIEVVNE